MLHRLLLLLLMEICGSLETPVVPQSRVWHLFAMEIPLRGMPRALLSKPLTTERHSTPEGSFSSVSAFAYSLVVPRAK